MENCIICLENIKNDSFIHKCIRKCNCNYKIHTLCLINYVTNNIDNKKDVSCLTCKTVIIEYIKYKLIKNKINSFLLRNKKEIRLVLFLFYIYINCKIIINIINIIYMISSNY